MDPFACVRLWLEAHSGGDHEGLDRAAVDYNAWIASGGFPVKGTVSGGLTYTIWGLALHRQNSGPMSPVHLGDADTNTFVTAEAIAQIIEGT